jgi:hypothetical protein
MQNIDLESKCWSASDASEGTEAALWAIAAGLFSLATATDRLAHSFGPDAEPATPLRALETLASAVDNVGDAVSDPEAHRRNTRR